MRVAIAHAAWAPGRTESLARLRSELQDVPAIFRSEVREPAVVWARRVWEWVADQAGPVAVLNDDVHVCPRFLDAASSVADAALAELVSLHVQAPGAAPIAAAGGRWARCYWLTGPAYLLWPETARSLLDFWAALPWSVASSINEDNVAIAWAWQHQRPILHTLPALTCHDTAVPSSLGYDDHPHRVPSVPWTDAHDLARWPSPEDAPLVDNPWCSASHMAAWRAAVRSEGGLCGACIARPAVAILGHVRLCSHCAAGAGQAMLGTLRR